MRFGSTVLAAMLLLLAACSGGGGHATPTTTVGTPTTGRSGATTRVEAGLRGVPVASVDCRSARPLDTRTVIRDPQVFVICRYGLQGVSLPSATVAAGTPSFQRLLAALSERDLPPTTTGCLELSEFAIPVFAQNSHNTYKVTLPHDGCDLIRREVYAAIDSAVGARP